MESSPSRCLSYIGKLNQTELNWFYVVVDIPLHVQHKVKYDIHGLM